MLETVSVYATFWSTTRRLLLMAGCLGLVACASGPPKPLARPPGADLPAWVVDGHQPRRELANPATAEEGTDIDPGTTPQTRPARTSAPQGPRVPARFTAVGQARLDDAASSEQEAKADAQRALQRMLDVRIRRALLRYLDSREELASSTRDQLRIRIWELEVAPHLAGLPLQVRQTAFDEPPEVVGPRVTFAEAVVPFEDVLDAVATLASNVFDTDHSPSRNRLAELLAARQ